jgi:hypothetical protein
VQLLADVLKTEFFILRGFRRGTFLVHFCSSDP